MRAETRSRCKGGRGLRQKIRNTVYIDADGVDLTTLTDVEVYVKQARTRAVFLQYVPVIVDAKTMYFEIPKSDADRLVPGEVLLQFAFRYSDGTPDASDIYHGTVAELLKEAGYDPD